MSGVLLIAYAAYNAVTNPANFSDVTSTLVFAALGALLLIGTLLVVLANASVWLQGVAKLLGRFARRSIVVKASHRVPECPKKIPVQDDGHYSVRCHLPCCSHCGDGSGIQSRYRKADRRIRHSGDDNNPFGKLDDVASTVTRARPVGHGAGCIVERVRNQLLRRTFYDERDWDDDQ